MNFIERARMAYGNMRNNMGPRLQELRHKRKHGKLNDLEQNELDTLSEHRDK